MLSGLIALLGGSAFRTLLGEFFHWFTAAREHAREIERMQEQEKIDAAQHARNLEAMRVQKDLGVEVIRVKAETDIDQTVVDAWKGLVDSTTKLTGIKFIDVWNQAIRPLLATLAIFAVLMQVKGQGWALTEWDRELVGAILGIYLADRQLSKRGK